MTGAFPGLRRTQPDEVEPQPTARQGATSIPTAGIGPGTIDRLWAALSAGGEIEMCGWLKDRYGISWQIVPTVLSELMADPDRARARRVMEAMLEMKKLDIAGLERAYQGEAIGTPAS